MFMALVTLMLVSEVRIAIIFQNLLNHEYVQLLYQQWFKLTNVVHCCGAKSPTIKTNLAYNKVLYASRPYTV